MMIKTTVDDFLTTLSSFIKLFDFRLLNCRFKASTFSRIFENIFRFLTIFLEAIEIEL